MARKSRTPLSSLDGDGVSGDMLLESVGGIVMSNTGELIDVSSMLSEFKLSQTSLHIGNLQGCCLLTVALTDAARPFIGFGERRSCCSRRASLLHFADKCGDCLHIDRLGLQLLVLFISFMQQLAFFNKLLISFVRLKT